MLTRSLAAVLAVTALAASAPKRKAPMIQATLEASVTFGPGREPPPGSPPFQPKLECSLAFAAPPPTGLTVRLWLVPAGSAGGKAPSTLKGAKALRHETVLAEASSRALRADWPQGCQAEAWQAAAEFLVGSRIRGYASVTVKSRYLPSAPPRGGRDQDN